MQTPDEERRQGGQRCSTHFAENDGLDEVAHQPSEPFVELADVAVELAIGNLDPRVRQTEAADFISESVGYLFVGEIEGTVELKQVEVARRVSLGTNFGEGRRRSHPRKQF